MHCVHIYVVLISLDALLIRTQSVSENNNNFLANSSYIHF